MESILEELQGQIEELELSEEMETIVYIDLAALKQVSIYTCTHTHWYSITYTVKSES